MKRKDAYRATIAMPMSPRPNHQRDAEGNGGGTEVELTCEAPHAENVFVAGDFNHWRVGELRLRRNETGSWKIPLCLAPGRYQYRFIVDGEWQDDPHASIRVPNEFGSNNCVFEIPLGVSD